MNKSIRPVLSAFIAFGFLSLIILSACKKKLPASTPVPVNYICDGNGTPFYQPLRIGYKWEYYSTDLYNYSLEITGKQNVNGKEYFETTVISSLGFDIYYYRFDPNADVYKYNDDDLKEYLEVPANPTVGQMIATYNNGDYIKVQSLNANFALGECHYTGLMAIGNYSSTGTLWYTTYYKKGLGVVGVQYPGGDYEYLEKVTLKI